jgi:2-polyprenyl-3-methyl-5-hydroxy-6-metoxy-1,4-benzoquinol methylase
VCGHADATVVREHEQIAEEMEALWAFHEKRLRPGTPISRLMDRVVFSERPPTRLVQCRDCGLLYRNPVERPHELWSTYADADVGDRRLHALHEAQRRAARVQARRVLRRVGRGAAVLEVGSYVGGFLAAAQEIGLRPEGVDIGTQVNAFTRRLGFRVTDGELAAIPEARPFDAIVIWNTFDQLADPRAVLYQAHARLRPGGVIAIRVPNGAFYARGSTGSRMTRYLFATNNLLGFPYRYGFTTQALHQLLRDTGWVPDQDHGDVLVPTADRWTRPWARAEQQVARRATALVARRSANRAPWFETFGHRP